MCFSEHVGTVPECHPCVDALGWVLALSLWFMGERGKSLHRDALTSPRSGSFHFFTGHKLVPGQILNSRLCGAMLLHRHFPPGGAFRYGADSEDDRGCSPER